jgi:hypothetical protein
MTFRKTWNNDSTDMATPPVPTLAELQQQQGQSAQPKGMSKTVKVLLWIGGLWFFHLWFQENYIAVMMDLGKIPQGPQLHTVAGLGLVVALTFLFRAVAGADRKLLAFLRILGLTITGSIVVGFVAYALFYWYFPGDHVAFAAGEACGSSITFCLFLSSIRQIELNRKAANLRELQTMAAQS